jgi:hypothetical protein
MEDGSTLTPQMVADLLAAALAASRRRRALLAALAASQKRKRLALLRRCTMHCVPKRWGLKVKKGLFTETGT